MHTLSGYVKWWCDKKAARKFTRLVIIRIRSHRAPHRRPPHTIPHPPNSRASNPTVSPDGPVHKCQFYLLVALGCGEERGRAEGGKQAGDGRGWGGCGERPTGLRHGVTVCGERLQAGNRGRRCGTVRSGGGSRIVVPLDGC